MRAVVVDQPGGIEVLRLAELPTPAPGPREVLIRTAAATVNWGDIQKREGIYPDPVVFPAVLGMEAAGVVGAVGSDVPKTWVGRRVTALGGPRLVGGYAESISVPLEYVLPLPDDVEWRTGAAFPLASLTAWHILRSAASIGLGDVVLIHAISGSVGLALTQIADLLGATAIGTVGDASKVDIATAAGAQLVIDRSRSDFAEEAMRFTGGRGVDLVVDSLGATVLPHSFDALRTYGRVINIGEAAGEPDFDVRKKLYERSTSLSGFEVLHAVPGSERWQAGIKFVLEHLADGTLRIPVGSTRPLEGVAELHAAIAARGTTGKLVIDVDPSMN